LDAAGFFCARPQEGFIVLDEIFEIFERDRRSPQSGRGGIRGFLDKLADRDDDDGRGRSLGSPGRERFDDDWDDDDRFDRRRRDRRDNAFDWGD
jgi:hypothetical protein